MLLSTLALGLLLATTSVAQQKPAKKSKSAQTGTMSAADAIRNDPSRANNQDGLPAGTGTTLEQTQAAKTPAQPTATDARSSTMTGPSSVKARKIPRKSGY